MYLYVKALHVFAVVAFIGGMLAMALALRVAIAAPRNMDGGRFGETILRWDGFVTTPALAVVWMAGFTMAFGAGWESSPWLLLKMIPVVLLSGLHSLQATALRRLLREGKMLGSLFRAAPVAILVTFACIAWLAVTKPF
ncbi:CopD family protein [Rhizobium laguerreae]|uniref:Protoporphyrinogen IX oxidase n=1 Tax=Rhizobium laguerreae TaxID=1076926 RepID=A0AAX2QB94_9HYPH|nr:CopD family protein [Rhizobium laguerreae]TCU14209.1 putative membrane protein [Rhizobium laguerreae]